MPLGISNSNANDLSILQEIRRAFSATSSFYCSAGSLNNNKQAKVLSLKINGMICSFPVMLCTS